MAKPAPENTLKESHLLTKDTLHPVQKTPLRNPFKLKVTVWGETDVGREREGNEDTIYPQSDGRGLKYTPKENTLFRKGQLLIVSDGIGGALAGSEASQWALRRAVENYYELPGINLGEDLRNAITHANASLYQYMQSTNTPDAGCTMSAAVIHNNLLYLANVGDSRVYLIRNRQIYQLTRDHTLTQQKIDQGLIDPTMADTDASRSVLTRSLGALPNIQVDLFTPTPLEPGDLILLCSDGLYDMIDNGEIAHLAQNSTPKKSVQRLIKMANRQGGLDNISVIIARVPGNSLKSTSQPDAFGPKIRRIISHLTRWQRVAVLILTLLTVSVSGVMGWTISKSVISTPDILDSTPVSTSASVDEVNPTLETHFTATPISQSQVPAKATSTVQPTTQISTPTDQPSLTPEAPGAGTSDRDGDLVLDNDDACPYQAGLEQFDGCPDTDADGIPDTDDDCPTEGLATKPEDRTKPLIRGCLDTDQDGFLNVLDACPSIWATANTDGCPVTHSENDGEECLGGKPECDGTLVCTDGEWRCLVVNE